MSVIVSSLLWDLVRFERVFPELDQQKMVLLPYEILAAYKQN